MPNRKQRFVVPPRLRPTGVPPALTGDSSSAETMDHTLGYLADLLAENREELTRADSKASLLLAAVGVIVGALIAGFAGSKWSPLQLTGEIQWLWWLGVAAGAFGILSIAASVYPRIHQSRTPHPGAPTYYGHVAQYADVDAFRQAIEKAPSSKERLINQAFVTSGIVLRKYVLLRRGLRSLLLAIAACVLAAGLNVLLGGR